jgi:hypothetical protein
VVVNIGGLRIQRIAKALNVTHLQLLVMLMLPH